MALNNNHIVIMAGGIGSRFWPMSTPQMPKQFIDVLGCGRTLLQLTVDRFQDICPSENIWVVTSVDCADVVKEQLPSIPVDHILLEPCRRNTAPCIAYVSWKIKAKNPKANIVVTPSDHVVMDVREFARVINSAMKFTADSDAIVTLGMKANRPETGYGYIEADLSMACPSNKEIYRVDAFKEKPDLEVARRYIQRKNYFYLGSRNACGRFSTPFVVKGNSISGVCGQKKPHFGQNRHISVQQWQMFVKQLSISCPCNTRSFCL